MAVEEQGYKSGPLAPGLRSFHTEIDRGTHLCPTLVRDPCGCGGIGLSFPGLGDLFLPSTYSCSTFYWVDGPGNFHPHPVAAFVADGNTSFRIIDPNAHVQHDGHAVLCLALGDKFILKWGETADELIAPYVVEGSPSMIDLRNIPWQ